MDPKTLGERLTALTEKVDALGETPASNQDPEGDPAKVSFPDIIKMAQDGRVVDPDGNKVNPATLLVDLNANVVSRGIGQIDGALGGVPIGSAIAGGFVGILVAEIIDGAISPTSDSGGVSLANSAVKLGFAWGAMKFMPRYVGRTAAIITAGVLIYTVARDWLPLDEWISNAVSKLPSFGNKFGNRGQVAVQQQQATTYSQVDPGQGGAGVDRFAAIYGS